MDVLWRLGEGSVRQVQSALEKRRQPAYTTVQTILLRLEQKKAIRRARKIGHAFIFEPLITQKSAYRRLVNQFFELFDGSAQPVVSHLIDSGKFTLEDLRVAEELLAKKMGA